MRNASGSSVESFAGRLPEDDRAPVRAAARRVGRGVLEREPGQLRDLVQRGVAGRHLHGERAALGRHRLAGRLGRRRLVAASAAEREARDDGDDQAGDERDRERQAAPLARLAERARVVPVLLLERPAPERLGHDGGARDPRPGAAVATGSGTGSGGGVTAAAAPAPARARRGGAATGGSSTGGRGGGGALYVSKRSGAGGAAAGGSSAGGAAAGGSAAGGSAAGGAAAGGSAAGGAPNVRKPDPPPASGAGGGAPRRADRAVGRRRCGRWRRRRAASLPAAARPRAARRR